MTSVAARASSAARRRGGLRWATTAAAALLVVPLGLWPAQAVAADVMQAQWRVPDTAATGVEGEIAHRAHPSPAASSARQDPPVAPTAGHVAALSALADGDALGALAHLSALPAPERGAARVEREALRAKALWRLGRFSSADAAFERLEAADPRGDHLPSWFVAGERAQLALEWADRVSDPERRRAIVAAGLEYVARALRHRKVPERPLLELLRVDLRVRAYRSVAPDGRRAAARRLDRDAARFLDRYPNAPRAPEVALVRAEAVAVVRGPKAGIEALRAVHLEWAGHPASDDALRLAERLAAEHGLRVPRLSRAESLAYATRARRLRWYEASRAALDGLLAEPNLPPAFRRSVLRERAYTAYRQRDYAQCAADLRELRRYTASVHGDLVRCYERAHQYDEALAAVLDRAKARKGRSRAAYLWEAVGLAFRAGFYERTLAHLDAYREVSRGHRVESSFYRGMALLRLGRADEAAEAFEVFARSRRYDPRARYLLARSRLYSSSSDERAAAVAELRELAEERPFDYYGMWARVHLRRLGEPVDPPPAARRPAALERPPELGEVLTVLDGLGARYGDALPALRRARAFLGAGRFEAARREVRRAARTVRNLKLRLRGGRMYRARSEALERGLSWHREFRTPRLAHSRELRAVVRDRAALEDLERRLFVVAYGLDEPYDALRTGAVGADPYGMRWYVPAYRRTVEAAAARWGFSPSHLWALMYTESRFRRFVVSPVGARGAVQIMPYTARRLAERLGEIPVGGTFDPDRLYDIETNVRLAAYYLAELAVKFRGQMPLAYGSYNGGPVNVGRWVVAKASRPLPLDLSVEEIPFRETRRYVRRVMETEAIYTFLATGDLPLWDLEVDPRVRRNIDF